MKKAGLSQYEKENDSHCVRWSTATYYSGIRFNKKEEAVELHIPVHSQPYDEDEDEYYLCEGSDPVYATFRLERNDDMDQAPKLIEYLAKIGLLRHE